VSTSTPVKSNLGRKRGTGTRAKALLAMAQKHIETKLGVKDFDPVIFLLEVAADKEQDMNLRVQAASKATPYIHSTLKSIEIGGEEGGPIDINLATSKDRLAGMLAAVKRVVHDEVLDHVDQESDDSGTEVVLHLP